MTDWRKITEHWLAVEVLSRSSRVYDREFKRDAYFALGLQQVWLVDGVIDLSKSARLKAGAVSCATEFAGASLALRWQST